MVGAGASNGTRLSAVWLCSAADFAVPRACSSLGGRPRPLLSSVAAVRVAVKRRYRGHGSAGLGCWVEVRFDAYVGDPAPVIRRISTGRFESSLYVVPQSGADTGRHDR